MKRFQSILSHPLLKASFIYTICDAINKAVPFFILPVLSHYLLPSDYGLVANFGVLAGILNLLVLLTMDGAISVNFHRLTRNEIREYVFNAFLISSFSFLLIFAIFFFIQKPLVNLLEIPFKYQVLCLIMAFFNMISSINLIIWRLEEKPLNFGVYGIGNTLVNIVSSLILVITYKLGWQGRIIGMSIAVILFGLYSWIYLVKFNYIKLRFKIKYFRDALLFGLPLLPHALSFWLRSGIDRIYITHFWGAEQVGLYATGFQFGLLISFLIGAFNNAFSPYLFKTLSTTVEPKLSVNKRKLVKMTYAILLGLIFAGVLFIFFSKFIIEYWFSKEYLDSFEYVTWAIGAQVFNGFYLLFVNYIFFVKKTKQLATITMICALIQVILSYFLIRELGPIGAAYSTMAVSVINFILVMFYSAKVYKMPWLG